MVDVWRSSGPTDWPLRRGTLPNPVSVPIPAFGALMLLAPERRPLTADALHRQDRRFGVAWLLAMVAVVLWKFAERTGALVFDVNDLLATMVEAGCTLVLYRGLRGGAFLPPRTE